MGYPSDDDFEEARRNRAPPAARAKALRADRMKEGLDALAKVKMALLGYEAALIRIDRGSSDLTADEMRGIANRALGDFGSL